VRWFGRGWGGILSIANLTDPKNFRVLFVCSAVVAIRICYFNQYPYTVDVFFPNAVNENGDGGGDEDDGF
jgi:hypothetical protein